MITVDRIRKVLRFTHNKLDDEITETIKTAKAELVRLGVSSDIIETDDSLIDEAIKTYCLYTFTGDDKRSTAYYDSFKYQADCLRKTTKYRNNNNEK